MIIPILQIVGLLSIVLAEAESRRTILDDHPSDQTQTAFACQILKPVYLQIVELARARKANV